MRRVPPRHLAPPSDPIGGPLLTPLRTALLLLLLLLVALPSRPPAGAAIDVAGARVGTAADPPAAWVRSSTAPPDASELDRLAALSGDAPLFAAAPDGPMLLAVPPEHLRAERNSAVDWRITGGTPGDTVALLLLDAGGPLDSARVALDATGAAQGAFRLHPAGEGWHDWRVEMGDHVAPAGAWVRPARPLRTLVAAGAGSIEAREVARALERRGGRVTLATDLGRGLTLGRAPAGLPDARALDSVDVVLVLAGIPVDPDAAEVLRTFLRRGGGVLVAGAAATAIADIVPGEPATPQAAELRWTAPAAVTRLPAIDVDLPVLPMTGRDGSVAASLSGNPVLVLGARGRGRWAALGLPETWHWALAAGRADALADFWTSLAGWLAGGAAEPILVSITPPTSPPGLPVDVRLTVLDSGVPHPASITLRRPGGASEALPVAWSGDDGAARFLAADTGTYQVALRADGDAVAGFRADPVAHPDARAWAHLARLASASGGRIVPADSLDAVARTVRGDLPLRPLIAIVILALAIADWTHRRLRGRS